MEHNLVIGTWVLAFATIALVGVTWWMLREQVNLLREQTEDNRKNLRMQNHLTFAARFDSRELQTGRIALAQLFLSNSSHDRIKENVLDFFEDLGMFSQHGYLDEELAWNTFGFYAVRWWAVCKNYVLEERKAQNDSTLFTDFEELAKRFTLRDKQKSLAEAADVEIRKFLEGEANL